jgi:hypothetical protein
LRHTELWKARQSFVPDYVKSPKSYGQNESWYIPAEWDQTTGAYIGPPRDDRGRYIKAQPATLPPDAPLTSKPVLKDYRTPDGKPDVAAFQRDLMRWQEAQT